MNQDQEDLHSSAYIKSLPIEPFKNQNEAFEHLYQRLGGVMDQQVHQDLFNIIGKRLAADGVDVSNLVEDWGSFSLKKKQLSSGPVSPTLYQSATDFINLGSNDIAHGEEVSENAKRVYDLLDSVTATTINQDYQSGTWSAIQDLNQLSLKYIISINNANLK